MGEAELVRQGLVLINQRKRQIASLRAELARLANTKPGIKSPYKAELMGVAWHKLHEALSMLTLLQERMHKLQQRQRGRSQALRCARSAPAPMPR